MKFSRPVLRRSGYNRKSRNSEFLRDINGSIKIVNSKRPLTTHVLPANDLSTKIPLKSITASVQKRAGVEQSGTSIYTPPSATCIIDNILCFLNVPTRGNMTLL